MLASTLSTTEDENADRILKTAAAKADRPGSDKYQRTHMAQIFQDGLSFSGFERNKVFVKSGGKYVDLSDVSGADSEGDCRAACVADFDDDGDPDLFVNAAQRKLHHLYRNDVGAGGGGRFVKIKLRATAGHASAAGAIVKVARGATVQAQTLSIGGGFESQHADELVFGLGPATEARLSVRWPGRGVEDFGVVSADGRFLLVEGAGKPETYAAKTFRFADPIPAGVMVKIGEPLPATTLTSLDGAPLKLEAPKGKKLVVNLWATTCASCVVELPFLQSLDQSGKYRVVGLSADPPSAAAKVAEVMKKRGASFAVGILPAAEAAKLFDLEKTAIPLTLVVGEDGRVEKILQGKLKEGSL